MKSKYNRILILSIMSILLVIMIYACKKEDVYGITGDVTLPVLDPVGPISTQYYDERESSSSIETEVPTTVELTTEVPETIEPTTEPPTEPTTPEPTEPETTTVEETEPAPKYTFRDLEGHYMYPTGTVNVRTLPSTEGEVVTTRHLNEAVWVTGQCIETGWYRIDIEGHPFYMSNGYLSETKIVIPETTQAPASQTYNTSGFVYYTVANQWPERAYEEYLYSCLVDRGIAWWYPYAVAQIWQESRWNPSSYNGVDAGICQFNEAMFPARAAHHANYPEANVWNAYDSLYVYSFYIRDVLRGCNNDVEAAWSYYIKGHFNDPHPSYIAACWKWYNALGAH